MKKMNILDYKEHLKHLFRKTPKLQNDFERLSCLIAFGDYNDIDDVIDNNPNTIDTTEIADIDVTYLDNLYREYNSNKQLFKNIGLNFRGFFGENGTDHKWLSVEEFDDAMVNEIQNAKVLKYQKSILRENSHLADDESRLKFQSLMELQISKKKVGDHFKKIKAWDSSAQLNMALDEFISICNNKDIDDYIYDVEQTFGANVVSSDDNILIIEISNYNASSKLGSSRWCISYDERYWENYEYANEFTPDEVDPLKESENKTFFVFDFNKHHSHVNYKIAYTTLPNSKIIYANNKNDENILNDFKEEYDDIFAYIKKSHISAFSNDKDEFNSMDHIELAEKPSYIEINMVNPILAINDYLNNDFVEDIEDAEEYDDLSREHLIFENYKEFNQIIDIFTKTSLGKNLINNGNSETIKTLFSLKDRFSANIDLNIINSFKNFDINLIRKSIEINPNLIFRTMMEITSLQVKDFKYNEGVTENFISSVFQWTLEDQNKQNLFKIFMHKQWDNDDFLKNTLEEQYDNMNTQTKSYLLKSIHNMPEKNVELFLNKLNNDESYTLKDQEFTFQDLFTISSSKTFQNKEFKKNSHIIKEIKSNIIKNNDLFKGNGLIISNNDKKGIYESSSNSFKKLNAIADNKIISNSTLKKWLTEISTSVSSPFRGIDIILMKKRGNYNNYLEYYNDHYGSKNNNLKNSIS
jgi:hypothetical protein